MIKKIYIGILAGLLSACVLRDPYRYCPLVTIDRYDARLIQKVNYQDDFEVEFKGVEGFCWYDERVKQEKARITPVFVVRKLRNTDESDVHFRWFTNTIKGPPAYLGKKSYFAEVSMAKGERSKEFRGEAVDVKIPRDMMYEFEIFAGLVISPQEQKYNRRIFDVDFDYYEDTETSEPSVAKLKVYPELYYEDGSVAEPEYITPGRPQKKQGCSSCGV